LLWLWVVNKPPMDLRDPVALRTLGGLWLRVGQAEQGLACLQQARAARSGVDALLPAGVLALPAQGPLLAAAALLAADTEAAHEDLLLALAYARLGRLEEARRHLGRAVATMDRLPRGGQAGAALLAGADGPLPLLTALRLPPPADPRALGPAWEEGLELQVLRREVEKLLAAKP
jgi:hypothetical protein